MTSTTRKNSADERNAGILLLISGMQFLLMITVAEAFYPGYSVHDNAVSDLGALGAPTFALYEPAIIVWGLFWFLGAYLYWRNMGRTRSMIAGLLPGSGVLVVAAFPENLNVVLHSIGSVIAIFSGIYAILLSSRQVRSPLRYSFLSLGLVAIVGTLVEFGGYGSALWQTLGLGGWERVLAYPLLLWEIVFGSYLLSQNRLTVASVSERLVLTKSNHNIQ